MNERIVLKAALDEAVRNIEYWSSEVLGLGQLTKIDHRNGAAAWEIDNGLLTLRMVDRGTVECELVEFMRADATDSARSAWNTLGLLFVSVGWLGMFSPMTRRSRWRSQSELQEWARLPNELEWRASARVRLRAQWGKEATAKQVSDRVETEWRERVERAEDARAILAERQELAAKGERRAAFEAAREFFDASVMAPTRATPNQDGTTEGPTGREQNVRGGGGLEGSTHRFVLPPTTEGRKHYKQYTPKTAKQIADALPRAWELFNAEGGKWGPKYIAQVACVRPETAGRYLKVFREFGITEIGGIVLPD